MKKALEEDYVMQLINIQKVNNKYMKDHNKNKESSYLKCWDANNLHSWAMSQNLSVNKFELIKDTSQFNEDFIKNYDETNDAGYFLEIEYKSEN